MSNLQLNCWIEGTEPQAAFPITISRSEKVFTLRKNIYESLRDNFARQGISAFDLQLWRVDIPINNELKDATREFKVQDALFHHTVLSTLFLPHVDEGNIHIVVRAQTIDIGTSKRGLVSQAGPSKRMKQNEKSSHTGNILSTQGEVGRVDVLDVANDEITAIHDAINLIPDGLKLSDPAEFHRLPFPSILARQIHRFPLANPSRGPAVKYFTYMGRWGFQLILDQMENPDFQTAPIYVYGTSGYGKSYLLAALVCKLFKEEKRVVYFPDCQQLLKDACVTFLKALRFAYYNDPASLREINSVVSMHVDDRLPALVDFWRDTHDTYLVADQLNALEGNDEESRQARKLLDMLGYQRRYILSASANEKANRILAAKQQSVLIVQFYGGMDKDELEHWFRHYKYQLPKLPNEEYEQLIFQTGGIPLFLSHLLIPKIDPKEEPPSLDLKKYLTNIRMQIGLPVERFFWKKNLELQGTFLTRYYQHMEACVASTKLGVSLDPELYDHRFFFFKLDKDTGEYDARCTCGIALNAMLAVLFEKRFQDFNNSFWYDAVEEISNNPSIQGFLVEKILLRHIVTNGLRVVDSNLGRMDHNFFDIHPEWSNVSPSNQLSSTLHIPSKPNFKAIDGIILMVDGHKAHLFPIQITINSRHKDSESTFFTEMWGTWVKTLLRNNFEILTTFVWIDREAPSEESRPEVFREHRSGPKLLQPEYNSVHVTISQVDRRLGKLLSPV